jgi:hypothetical protein
MNSDGAAKQTDPALSRNPEATDYLRCVPLPCFIIACSPAGNPARTRPGNYLKDASRSTGPWRQFTTSSRMTSASWARSAG